MECEQQLRPSTVQFTTQTASESLFITTSISHLLRHFPSSAITWRHTSSNSVTQNYCCHAHEVTLSFMDTLIALTYLRPRRENRIYLYTAVNLKQKCLITEDCA